MSYVDFGDKNKKEKEKTDKDAPKTEDTFREADQKVDAGEEYAKQFT